MTYSEGLAALGDATRRSIFEAVAARPAPVADLARRFPVSRPAVSQHLRVLREAGLVTVRKDGARSIYSIDPRGLVELRAYLETFWDAALDNFKEAAERPKKRKTT